MRRREFLLAAAAVAVRSFAHAAQALPLRYADMHGHLGLIGEPANVREAMVANGMLIIARKIVADGPVIRRVQGKGVQAVRQPETGELASRFDATLERVRGEHAAERLIEIDSAQTLQRVASGGGPAVVLAAEGADFLECDVKRLDAVRKLGLVHLQLVHYRVSDVGDISTERPVHNGLTAFGRQVVAACNRLGVLVDVAHATSAGIEQALEVSTRPIVYSHGHVTATAPYWTYGVTAARAIHKPLAQKIAEKGGVVGIWPLRSQYRSLGGYAEALLDTAAALGPAHVGVGTDLFGLGGNTVIAGYEEFARLEELLVRRGASAQTARDLLGGNYLRVLAQALNANG